ncbi:MAG: DUF1648 domain-containing protein [Ruminococcaceae bacterium]|nr:DUF1648 domain-containing protein [Oscillospiraceae bacterium]
MIKNHKKKAVISSILILLPVLFGLIFWNQLPESMVSHWGGDGVADGTAPKAFVVFGMPLMLLAIHWLCLGLTCLDKKSAQYHNKLVMITYGIMPVLSIVVNGILYGLALGAELNLFMLLPAFLGVMFIIIGNYMPKTTRNRSMGIKLRWTMGNDENWQKTHRLGGRLQVVSGVLLLISATFSVEVSIGMLVAAIILAIVVPTVYSYMLYRKHKAQGIEYEPVFDKKQDKVALWIARIAVPLILVFVVVVMFVGDVSVTFETEKFVVKASFSETLNIPYENIDSVEFREEFAAGSRYMGFGSPTISTGIFQNEEFGQYTLYAYTNGEGCVILRQDDNVLVIVGKTLEETKGIYESLLIKIGK